MRFESTNIGMFQGCRCRGPRPLPVRFRPTGVRQRTGRTGSAAAGGRCHRGVYYRGRWYEGLYLHAGATEEDARQLQHFNAEVDAWAAWRDAKGRRAFAIPVARGSDDAEVAALDRISMGEWMRARGFTSERLRWLVDYGCRDDYGLMLEQASAWAGLFYFASRMKGPGAEAQPLLTWPEGNGRLVRHLYEKARARVRLGLAVAGVRTVEVESGGVGNRGGVEVVAVGREGRGAVGFRAERVVFAAPQFLTKYLLKSYREECVRRTSRSSSTARGWLRTSFSPNARARASVSRRRGTTCSTRAPRSATSRPRTSVA